MEEILIRAEKRDKVGKEYAKKIRKIGKIPSIIYGSDVSSIPVTLEKKDIIKIMKMGENIIFKVNVDKKTYSVMMKEFQIDPLTTEILHVDIYKVLMDKPVKVKVPISLVGTPIGVAEEGGFIEFLHRECDIECLPKDIPEKIDVEISPLHIGQSLKIEDIKFDKKIKILDDPDSVILTIEAPRKEVEEVIVVPAEEAVVEPEVIKKKKEEEEEKKEE
ncbi:MAG: 50S ribosomal protein L25 [Acidobacteriota bacterium]